MLMKVQAFEKNMYSLADVVVADLLKAARSNRGVDRRVMLDKNEAMLNANNLRPIAAQLAAHGIAMRLFGRRRLHAKTLVTESCWIAGSLNWTNGSEKDIQRGMFTDEAAVVAKERRWFEALWEAAAPFDGKQEKSLIATPPRRSLSAKARLGDRIR